LYQKTKAELGYLKGDKYAKKKTKNTQNLQNSNLYKMGGLFAHIYTAVELIGRIIANKKTEK